MVSAARRLHLGGKEVLGIEGATTNSSAIARPKPIRISITALLYLRINGSTGAADASCGNRPSEMTVMAFPSAQWIATKLRSFAATISTASSMVSNAVRRVPSAP